MLRMRKRIKQISHVYRLMYSKEKKKKEKPKHRNCANKLFLKYNQLNEYNHITSLTLLKQSFSMNHRTKEFLSLEKILKIIKSNCNQNILPKLLQPSTKSSLQRNCFPSYSHLPNKNKLFS